MAFSTADALWPITPDWSDGVQERLAFGTDVMVANASAVSQHRSWRPSPRRSFDFEVGATGGDRRVADMLLSGHSGAWQLPIWHDVQWLTATLASGAVSIPCATAGFDFVDGGHALLYTGRARWEIVQVDAIASDHLGLATATLAAYGPGSRLYPLRRAHVQPEAEERLLSDDTGRRRLSFDVMEACDWPVLAVGTEYLGHGVLEERPDESEDPTHSNSRLEQVVDYGSALPVVHDLPGIALRAQQTHWKLVGRERHTWYRSLLYTLCGRLTPLWLPSFAADLQLASDVAGGSAALPIEWAGYALHGLGKPNRKDLRIELADGTVLYRRITAAVDAGDSETLTLDSALDAGSIAPGQIRAISFMALATGASDETEIDHLTDADGTATSTIGWQAVVPDDL